MLPSLWVPLPSLVWCSSDVSLFHGKWLSGTGTQTKSRHIQPLDFLLLNGPTSLLYALLNCVGISDLNYHNLPLSFWKNSSCSLSIKFLNAFLFCQWFPKALIDKCERISAAALSRYRYRRQKRWRIYPSCSDEKGHVSPGTFTLSSRPPLRA